MDQLGSLLFLTSILFFNFIGRIVFSPLMPTIENDLGLTHANAGMLFLMISLGFFLSLIGSGFISCRIGHKKTIVTSAIAVGSMLWVLSTCENLWGMRVGMFLLGLGAGLYLPSGIASVTSIVHPKHWGKALAVHELAPNLSFVLAPLLSEWLMGWFSWRGVLLFLGICCLIIGIALRDLGKERKDTEWRQAFHLLVRSSENVLSGSWFSFSASELQARWESIPCCPFTW